MKGAFTQCCNHTDRALRWKGKKERRTTGMQTARQESWGKREAYSQSNIKVCWATHKSDQEQY